MIYRIRRLATDCFSQDLSGVHGIAAGAIVDLVTAAGAGGGDKIVWWDLPHGGQQDQLANLHGNIVVLGLIPERSGHAAAARRDGLYRVVARK